MLKFGKDSYRGHVEQISHHFYINESIENADDYVDLIDCLYQGSPTDTVYLHLNTRGGDLLITIQIINAIKSSSCTVIGVADGQVASAGSLLLFSCPNIAVQEFSFVMLHDGSEGSIGKVNENLKQARFSSDFLKNIYNSVYGEFFTEKEIEDVLDGKDHWLTSEDVKARVEATAQKKEEELEEQE